MIARIAGSSGELACSEVSPEIAEPRNVSETTVRQQARGVYRKSGLSGRHDLSAFFLEDLLAPRTVPR